MYELRYDEEICANCETLDCLTRCQYMDLGLEEARAERQRVLDGEDSRVLRECATCYACEEYCPYDNHLFERLAKENVEQWSAAGVEKILTLSPHAFHAIRNEYPKFGGTFEVYHYSQVLAALLPGRKFRQANAEPLRVTFHDPCYLGRHNKDYLTPRAVLGGVPGLELAEMDRAMGNALCCGGGGGNFFTDVLGGGADSSCRVRVREAVETGARVLAVACPKCAKMLADAITVEDLEDEIRVMDIAEIVEERDA